MEQRTALQTIIDFIGSNAIKIFGKPDDIYVKHLQSTESVDEETLDWIGNAKQNKQEIADRTQAKVILTDISVEYTDRMEAQGKVLIHVENPRLIIMLVAKEFFMNKPNSGIHKSSCIDSKAKISSSAFISPNCIIGNSIIGDNAKIYPNVTIYDGVTIGSNVVIQAGAVIGSDGLGCERKEDGTLITFPHLFGVEIGDDVEIGANCQIQRGVLTNTIIGSGCKINGLCFIGHNCILGKNVWISGDTMLAGSIHVDDNVTIWSKAFVFQHRKIGKGAIIGMGAEVTKNVPPNETWMGKPARRFKASD